MSDAALPAYSRGVREQEWISWDSASELTGIKVPTIEHAVRVGRIERRPRLGRRPSLRRDSVTASAERRDDEWVSWLEAALIVGCNESQVMTTVKHGELQTRPGSRASPSLKRVDVEAWRDRRASEPAPVKKAKPPPLSAPPNDGEVWPSTYVVALMLKTSRVQVGQLVRQGRLPGVKRGARVWVRRDHAERAAAARVFGTTSATPS